MERSRIRSSAVFCSSLVLVFLVLPVLFGGCRNRETGVGGTVFEVDTTYVRGPVSFRVALDRKEITIAQHVKLLLEARAREGYKVRLPSFGDKLYQFGIVDYRSYPPSIERDSTVVVKREYVLEPFLSGEYTIPPMTVTFWQEQDTTMHYVESDTIKVQVTSLLPEDKKNLAIRDIASPVSYSSDRRKLMAISAAVVLAGVIIYLVVSRKRQAVETEPRLPAHEIAFRRLEALLASGLLDEKRFREFTSKVSDILRYYIEDRFGIRAPERTTEEFLDEARDGLPIDQKQKEMLAEFLTYCDLVKFAALEPSSGEVKRLFESCRDFIDATKEEEVEAAA